MGQNFDSKIRGRSTRPRPMNYFIPLARRERIVRNRDAILDTAMGYGIDIAWVRKNFPGAEVHGIDSSIVMTDEIWDGEEFSYGRARQVVHEALGADILPECDARRGDARDLSDFDSGHFTRVFNFGMVHHLDRDDRREIFGEAYGVLRKGGIYVARGVSEYGLEQAAVLKPKYRDRWRNIRVTSWSGTVRVPNPDLDERERDMFERDLRRIFPGYDSFGERDRRIIEHVAGHPHAFRVLGYRDDVVGSDLRDIGYREVVTVSRKISGSVLRGLSVYARK